IGHTYHFSLLTSHHLRFLHSFPTRRSSDLPGIMAQSALFIAIFFGVQVIGERDAGVLAKLMVTPTPKAALVTGKAFAAGLRALVDRKSTRLNSSHVKISYAVFCLKKKNKIL